MRKGFILFYVLTMSLSYWDPWTVYFHRTTFMVAAFIGVNIVRNE